MFFSHIEYNGNIDNIKYDLISYIEDYFDPKIGDCYYFMDPYLDAIKSIQIPFQTNIIEDDNWSFLIDCLANKNVEIKIITRESLDGIISQDNSPPFKLLEINKAEISICKYIDTKFIGISLHDRYIVQERGEEIKALHIGPSLSDIKDKDISITKFTTLSARKILNHFNTLWGECIKTKEWKKG